MTFRLLFTLLMILAIAVFSAHHPQARSTSFDGLAVTRIVERADADFANFKMYRDQAQWVGKTIEFRGSIYQKPVIVTGGKDYVQVAGSGSTGDPINVVAYLDYPLPKPGGYEDNTTMIGPGTSYRFFGVLQKCRDFVSYNGTVNFLPTMDLMLIYGADDRSFERPLWVSRTLRRN